MTVIGPGQRVAAEVVAMNDQEAFRSAITRIDGVVAFFLTGIHGGQAGSDSNRLRNLWL
jgi:hypothetical protein